MPEQILKRTIQVGPFSAFFTNVNTAMRLPGHSHFATLTLQYETIGRTGFPAFATTYGAIQQHLQALTERPFRDHTNEDVAEALWQAFEHWTHPEIEKFDSKCVLCRLELAVRGVPDRIGHADGFTVYAIERASHGRA